jgi:penicillin-binding protein 1C
MRPGQAPVETCPSHVRLAVDTRTGRLASARTPTSFVEARTFVDLPPRYAAWAAGVGLPRPPSPSLPTASTGTVGRADAGVRVSVVSPANGERVMRDPETPAGQATLALKAVVDPPVPQIVWYVDGRPFKVVDYPYAARWSLEPGDHVFQARLAQGVSLSSTVRVRVD